MQDGALAHTLSINFADPTALPSLDELEKQYVLRVVDVCGGAKKRAARILGIDRKTLYRKLVRWGVQTTPDDQAL
jgi:DNA-binding NtrC family response regulator